LFGAPLVGRAWSAGHFQRFFEDSCMSATLSLTPEPFIDRRSSDAGVILPGAERRQFSNSHQELSPDARELAVAIDGYKLMHRRRFITFEEMLAVIKELGYSK
jgi:hypothetical protein